MAKIFAVLCIGLLPFAAEARMGGSNFSCANCLGGVNGGHAQLVNIIAVVCLIGNIHIAKGISVLLAILLNVKAISNV